MKFINKIEDPFITLDTINHIEIVSSILTDYGKNNYFEKELGKDCKKKNKNGRYQYIPFPFGGEVKRSILMRRLKDLKINSNFAYGWITFRFIRNKSNSAIIKLVC